MQPLTDAQVVRLLAQEFGLPEDNRIAIVRAARSRFSSHLKVRDLEEEALNVAVHLDGIRQRVAEALGMPEVPRIEDLPEIIASYAKRVKALETASATALKNENGAAHG